MKKVIYIDQPHTIRADGANGEAVIWEIDDDEGLDITTRENAIDIIPRKAALKAPHRVLKFTAEATRQSRQIALFIEQEAKPDQAPQPLPADTPRSDAAQPLPANTPYLDAALSGTELPTLPRTLTVLSNGRVRIPDSDALPDAVVWHFSDEKLNTHIQLTGDGVYLVSLPAGFHTLYYGFPDGRKNEIVIQSSPAPAAEPAATGTPGDTTASAPETDRNTDTDSNADLQAPVENTAGKQSWPRITGECAVEIRKQDRPVAVYPLKRTASLLIGRQSRSRPAVDIDLGRYTADTARISRNHLRMWISQDHLMLKNIGSHRVRFNGREMGPEQVAVLDIGGAIDIGELTLVIVEHSP